MTSVGMMASSVATSTCTSVLQEPFDHVAAWVGTSGTIVAGRNGTALQLPGTQVYRYTIPTVNESEYVTVGFAYKVASLAANRHPLQLMSDAGVTNHTTVRVQADGSLQVLIGGSAGTSVGTSAAGLVVANTWVYIELQVRMHDTLGTAVLRVNGTQVITAGPVDTKFGGTKTVLDTVACIGTTAVTEQYDDLYLSTGTGCGFQGDHAVVNTGPDDLIEPFNNVTAWGTGISSAAGGRTGNAGNISGSSTANHDIAAPLASPYATVGFAFKTSDVVGTFRNIVSFRDATSTDILTLRTETNGALALYLGTVTGPPGTSAAGLIVANTWNYVEIQTFINDSTGFATVRLNGTPIITFNGDTRTGTVGPNIAKLYLRGPGTGQTTQFDDLYLTMGPDALFKGDPMGSVPAPAPALLSTTFTGTNGAAWTTLVNAGTIPGAIFDYQPPSTPAAAPAETVEIQSNKGLLRNHATAESVTPNAVVRSPGTGDLAIYYDLTIVTAAAGGYVQTDWRIGSAQNLIFEFWIHNSTFAVISYTDSGVLPYGITWADGDVAHILIQSNGTQHKAFLWRNADPRPTIPTVAGVGGNAGDSGQLQLQVKRGPAGQGEFYYDNFQVYGDPTWTPA